MYQNYADTRMLAEHFESARRWVDFIRRNNPNLLWQKNRGNDYNDWLNGDMTAVKDYPRGISAVPNEVFATAFFAHSTEIVAKMAEVSGAAGRRRQIRQAVGRTSRPRSTRRTLPPTAASRATRRPAMPWPCISTCWTSRCVRRPRSICSKRSRSTRTIPRPAFRSTHRMMLELSRNGQHDEAWRLMNLRTVPSWGYMVEMGATTIWERWDGYVKGRGFQDPGMNSFNHWAFGSVGEWVWRELAGINPDDEQPGYKHFFIRPRPCGDLTWVKARYDSIRGPIVSDWKIADGRFQLHVEIPANTTATVYVPAARRCRGDRERQARGRGRGREVREDGRRQRRVCRGIGRL